MLTYFKFRNVAKNVILFIGDSMGPNTVTAGRFYKSRKDETSGRDSLLSWDKFPHVGMAMVRFSDSIINHVVYQV